MLSLLIRTLVFVAVVPGTVVFLLPRWIAGSHPDVRVDTLGVTGAALIVAGILVAGACMYGFIADGRGTPAPYDPPRWLVTRRLYRHVRNPMYCGILLTLVGEAALLHSAALLVYGAIAWLCFHAAVVLFEEPGLRRRFGVEYEDYVRRVPRWLPRLNPWPPRDAAASSR